LPPQRRYETIDGEELYRRLATGEPVVLLDVRTESEHRERHIPGSMLIPLHDLEARLKQLPNSGTPIAVICEQGQRSASACHFLAENGYGPLLNLAGGLLSWPGPTSGDGESEHHRHGIAPSSFLVENFAALPRGLALDVGMGEGRNAIYLATRGFDVDGVDADPGAVARARAAARKLGAPIRAIVGNFQDGSYIIPLETYNVIIAFNYLHRPLFQDIRDGVVPGGVVVYQTFTIEQARFGRPRDPAHLLQPHELKRVFQDWEILRYRELIGPRRTNGEMRSIAGIVARRPAQG
jgi:rhodanese-related sulfurtransferase